MGEACPKPGNSVFHTTLLVALQYTGTPFSWLVPSSRGPRQQGQFSAAAAKPQVSARTNSARRSQARNLNSNSSIACSLQVHPPTCQKRRRRTSRSEEHTSELQSLRH